MEAKQLRIVFMGTPEFAVPSLKRLVNEGYQVVAVVTVPDKPAGRGQQLKQSDVKVAALELGIPVLQPERFKDESFLEQLRALQPDLGIVIAFKMLPEVVWSMPRLGTFNLHASLLPEYRGAAPINWAIINGERYTGITTFLLNHEIDKGAILAQYRVEILPTDNVGTLYERLMTLGSELVLQTVDRLATETVTPVDQMHYDETQLHPAPKIFKEDCRIDWNQPGRRIIDFIRGLSPYPAAWASMYKGERECNTLKIFQAHYDEQQLSDVQPGEIVTDGRTYLAVACADGTIYIDELQIAGKRRLAVHDLLLGMRDIADYTLR
jgi:methionyl-tRNA formyltransferase